MEVVFLMGYFFERLLTNGNSLLAFFSILAFSRIKQLFHRIRVINFVMVLRFNTQLIEKLLENAVFRADVSQCATAGSSNKKVNDTFCQKHFK